MRPSPNYQNRTKIGSTLLLRTMEEISKEFGISKMAVSKRVKQLLFHMQDLMNTLVTGKFISLRRKHKNLTQEQLAEELGISNKTISKWETGKCMPDYSIIKSLCEKLDITVGELIDGELSEEKTGCFYDNEQILDSLRRTQELEKQNKMVYGILLIVMGIALQALSHTLIGSDVKDFMSGLLLGLSVTEMLIGIYVVGKCLRGN